MLYPVRGVPEQRRARSSTGRTLVSAEEGSGTRRHRETRKAVPEGRRNDGNHFSLLNTPRVCTVCLFNGRDDSDGHFASMGMYCSDG